MKQLIKGMLAVSSWLAPTDRGCCLRDLCSNDGNLFSVALHRQMLQICRESLEIVLIRKDRHRLGTEEVVVPDGQQAHEHRHIPFEGSGEKVHVHLMEAIQHGAKILWANGKHDRKAHRRTERIAPTHPVPDLEHVSGIDTEVRHFGRIHRDGNKVFSH